MRDGLLKFTAIHSSPIGWEGEWEGQECKRRSCRGSWALVCRQKVQAWGRGKTVLLLTSPTPASFCPRCQVPVPPTPSLSPEQGLITVPSLPGGHPCWSVDGLKQAPEMRWLDKRPAGGGAFSRIWVGGKGSTVAE